MKIISFYLPQFHTFPENDAWWGKGFTEWTNVKNSKPIFKGHLQPRVPADKNYYDLTDANTIRWQTDLAREYGVYGFCWYHYWFDGHMLMQKPMELMLKDRSIDFPFCICWANENWTRQWAKKSREVLISQTYGEQEDWKRHFEYLLPFLKDERYIKIDDEPIFVIYRPEIITPLRKMLTFWKQLAKENGLKGIKFIYQQSTYNHLQSDTGDLFDFGIEYEPNYVKVEQQRTVSIIKRKVLHEIVSKLKLPQKKWSTIYYDYDDTWKRILNIKPRDEKMIPGAFVDWDNTPRYKNHASIILGYSKEKFQKYLAAQIRRAKNVYHKDMIFLFAWNEWGEGGFLEPDEHEGYGRLNAVKQALLECDEWEE